MKILITSGGTKIPIDGVRSITNMSSGTFGSKIATEFLELKHEVVFMKAKGSKTPVSITIDGSPWNENASQDSLSEQDYAKWLYKTRSWSGLYMEYEYTTYEQYAEMLKFVISVEKPDIIFLAAAVSDYGVENPVDGKIRSNDMLTIKLCQLPKLISRVKEWAPKAKLVGFKLLVNSKDNELIDAAKRSVAENGCDMVVANDLRDIKDNNHILHLVLKDSIVKCYPVPEDSNSLAKMVVRQALTL
jgi:phosphopantothenate-cysteine ligase